MCHFLSVCVLRNGDICHHPLLDSHSDIVTYFKLPDKQHTRHFAKVEFTPAPDKDGVPQYADYNKYTLRVDEETEPAWFAEHRETVEKKLRAMVKAMIIDDDTVPLVLDGCRILVKGAKVREARAGRIIAMIDNAKVATLSGAQVDVMRGTSKVSVMWGNSKVGVMWDTSQAPNPPITDKRATP